MRTGGRHDWLRWRAEPVAHAYRVCQTGHSSQGIPERGAEDVGVEGLLDYESAGWASG
jgi:hypothetical protein